MGGGTCQMREYFQAAIEFEARAGVLSTASCQRLRAYSSLPGRGTTLPGYTVMQQMH